MQCDAVPPRRACKYARARKIHRSADRSIKRNAVCVRERALVRFFLAAREDGSCLPAWPLDERERKKVICIISTA